MRPQARLRAQAEDRVLQRRTTLKDEEPYYRRKAGRLPPPKWQHPAALSSDPVLRAASVRAQQLGEVHGWSLSTVRCTMDGLMLLLAERGAGEPVTVSEIRARG